MENKKDIAGIKQKIQDITGCEMREFHNVEHDFIVDYVGRFMPESSFMEGNEKVIELAKCYCNELVYDFWMRLVRKSSALLGEMYFFGAATPEGVSYKLLANGIEVWQEFEKQIICGGLKKLEVWNEADFEAIEGFFVLTK